MAQRDHREEKREHILQAATEIFSQYGFHKATVEQIAEKAHIGKGTVYLYFSSKQELFRGVVFEGFLKLFEEMDTRLSQKETLLDKLYEFVILQVAFFDNHRDLANILTREQGNFDSELQKSFWELEERYHCLIEMLMQEGMKEGTIKDMDVKKTALFFWGTLHSFFVFKFFHPEAKDDAFSPQDCARFIVDLFLQGAAAS